MSDYTDSLRNENDDEFKTFLLDQLSNAESLVQKHRVTNLRKPRTMDEAYWQGRKDAFRLVLASYLNRPEIADHIRTSAFREIAMEGK